MKILWLGIFIAGALGAIARYQQGRFVGNRFSSLLPLGTLSINLLGSFFVGLLVGYLQKKILSPNLFSILDLGFAGAYTTFSSMSYETVRLIEQNLVIESFIYPILSLIFGLLAVQTGLYLSSGVL